MLLSFAIVLVISHNTITDVITILNFLHTTTAFPFKWDNYEQNFAPYEQIVLMQLTTGGKGDNGRILKYEEVIFWFSLSSKILWNYNLMNPKGNYIILLECYRVMLPIKTENRKWSWHQSFHNVMVTLQLTSFCQSVATLTFLSDNEFTVEKGFLTNKDFKNYFWIKFKKMVIAFWPKYLVCICQCWS